MCGRLVNLDTVARVIADYYHLKTDTQLAALDEALSRVPAETVGKELFGNSEQLDDTISRADALKAMDTWDKFGCNPDGKLVRYDDDKHYIPYVHYEDMVHAIKHLPSAQPPKEIPKRVLWSGWKGCRDTRYKCPNCEKPVRNDDTYCHRCGQRLMFPHISFTDYVPGEKQDVIVRWDDEG